MTRLEEMLQANEAYCKNPPVDDTGEDVHESKLPKKKIAVFTCMDTPMHTYMHAYPADPVHPLVEKGSNVRHISPGL